MAKVVVKSSSLVCMANTSSHSVRELTPWELTFILLDPIQKGILFSNRPEKSNTVIDHRKCSLSRTLNFFPSLSGRLTCVTNEDGTVSFFVDCNNAGAEFTHAAATNVSSSDILEARYVPEVVSSLFTLNKTVNYEGVSKPLLGVQVTELADGLFIGCTVNHVLADGTSFWHFFSSWSEISRGYEKISKAPVFERRFSANSCNEDQIIRLPELNQVLLERVFRFSKDSLVKLKEKARSEASSDKISTLQALLAHFWKSVVRSRQHRTSTNDAPNDNKEHLIIIMVDARPRVPLPDGYFGSAVYRASTMIRAHELLNKGVGSTAQRINELVSQQTSEAAIRSLDQVWEMTQIEFVVTSSPRFNVYVCDFGWGKPVAVRCGQAQRFDGKMTLFPTTEPGGIEVHLCLTPETMMAMEDDAEFMASVIS